MPILDNPRHEAFAQEKAKLMSDVEAYKAAFRCKQSTAEANATRMRDNDGITARIREIQSGTATATTLTVTRRREICSGIAEDVTVEPHVRIAATLAEAKHAGELIDRAELKVKAAPSQEDVAAAVQATLARRGLVPGRS